MPADGNNHNCLHVKARGATGSFPCALWAEGGLPRLTGQKPACTSGGRLSPLCIKPNKTARRGALKCRYSQVYTVGAGDACQECSLSLRRGYQKTTISAISHGLGFDSRNWNASAHIRGKWKERRRNLTTQRHHYVALSNASSLLLQAQYLGRLCLRIDTPGRR